MKYDSPDLNADAVGGAFLALVAIARQQGDASVADRARALAESTMKPDGSSLSSAQQFVVDAFQLSTLELNARWFTPDE